MAEVFFIGLIIIISIFLILIIIVQNPKGGGINPSMTGSDVRLLGAKNTTTFLDKATWFLAISLVVLVIGFNGVLSQNNNINTPANTELEQKIDLIDLEPAGESKAPLSIDSNK